MHATPNIDLTRGPVLAALRGPGLRSPADIALLVSPFCGAGARVLPLWIAAGKSAPATPRAAAWAPLEAFGVGVFVRVERAELVVWRTGPSFPDCRWVKTPAPDALPVRPTLWDDVCAALDRQLGAYRADAGDQPRAGAAV